MHLKKRVKLLTFNVFLRPPPIKHNADDFKEERFAEILKFVNDYDILCFEEMFQTGSFRPQRMIDHAIDNKFYYWKMSQPPLFTPGPVVDSGLLVLSKYPILASHFQSYGIGILSDSASDKGYIYCKIQIKQQILHLFVTHLQASYMVPGHELQRELSVKTRQAQEQILMTRIQEHLKTNNYREKDLVLLVGDFNINSRELPFRLSLNSPLRPESTIESKKLLSSNNRSHSQNNDPENREFYSEYNIFKYLVAQRNFGLIDHMIEGKKEHPITLGDNEQILTDHDESRSFQRLDYIFTLKPNNTNTNMQTVKDSCKVQQFKRPGSQYGQLSDHYGVSIQIE